MHEFWPAIDCHRLMLPTVTIGYYAGCVILGSYQSWLVRTYDIIDLMMATAVIAGMYDIINSMIDELQRSLAKPTVQLLCMEMLEAIDTDAQQSGSLSDLRLAMVCLLAFASFLRFSELVNLKPTNIQIQGDVTRIHIEYSKTDQLKQGDEVLISRTRSKTCPVAMVENYMETAGMSMFPVLSYTEN